MKITYLLTTHELSKMPQDEVPEVVVVGKSNVGKSSLINFMGNDSTLAKVGKKPGKTKAISFFDINGKIRLVDVPGYGFASVSKEQQRMFGTMLDVFFKKRKNLALVLLLVDVRRGIQQEDLDMIEFLESIPIKFVVVGTKIDKTNQSERAKFANTTKNHKPILISTVTKKGIDDLFRVVILHTIERTQ